MAGFCPHDWHQTTEEDLVQMSLGEDYFLYEDSFRPSSRIRPSISTRDPKLIEANRRPYAIHDEAVSQAKREGLQFHELDMKDQARRLDAAERVIDNQDGYSSKL